MDVLRPDCDRRFTQLFFSQQEEEGEWIRNEKKRPKEATGGEEETLWN